MRSGGTAECKRGRELNGWRSSFFFAFQLRVVKLVASPFPLPFRSSCCVGKSVSPGDQVLIGQTKPSGPMRRGTQRQLKK